MKLTTRGFTLVELMIVIAIIGILAAALFPSMTAYLKRSRDAARTANIKDISTALGAYYSDKEVYPNSVTLGGVANTPLSTCLDSGTLITGKYMDKIPTDPSGLTRNNGCGTNGNYSYGSGFSTQQSPQFIIGGIFETEFGGNIGAHAMPAYIGSGFTATNRDALDTNAAVYKKGNGSGYLIYK